jgi:hypothetical protein
MKQQLYLESRFGYKFPDGSVMFWLQDSLVIPNPREYQFYVSVVDSSFPLTHYTITNRNNDLELIVNGETYNINLPLGNYNIDEIKLYMNDRLPHGFVVSYSENTNKLKVSTTQPNTNLEIGVGTTCGELLGIVVGESSENGVYEAPNGINLAGTSHFYIRSNLRTQNRDPVRLGFSHLMAKIPITRSFNGVEKYSQSGFSFVIQDRSIDYIVISVLDEDLLPVEFHGGHWSITIEFSILRAQPFSQPEDYRSLISNGSIGGTKNVADDKRQIEVTRG